MNDFRPVALTSVAMKCLEKLVLKAMDSIIPITADPLQFTYRKNRSVDDTVALALHSAVEHLDTPNTYVRMLFLDYSSAFNTVLPTKLVAKLAGLGLPSSTRSWILNFLTERVGNSVSTALTISTGTPRAAGRAPSDPRPSSSPGVPPRGCCAAGAVSWPPSAPPAESPARPPPSSQGGGRGGSSP